jgi:ribosomal protein S18 acetylase RimI-like enzyme
LDGVVIIRDARAADLPDVGELRVTAYVTGGHMSPDSGYAPRLRTLGSEGGGSVLVAVAEDGDTGPAAPGGRIIGTIMLQPAEEAGGAVQSPDEVEIRALAVSPEAQGRGVGRALLEAALARAAQEGVTHLVLATQQDMHTAQRMYEKAGFRRMPERDWAPVPDGMKLIVYGMRLA